MSYFARVPEVEPLSRSFFARDVLEVAPALLGCLLVNAGVTLRLTEVEAYAGEKGDPGSHAFRGQTPRTAVMFGPAGHLYVYFTYGMHFCANVVTGEDGLASAVLLRAGAVVDGHELAATRRPGVRERDWARGPARLTVTMGLAREENGLDLCGTARTGPGAGGRMLPPVRPRRPRNHPHRTTSRGERPRGRRHGIPLAVLARRRADGQPLSPWSGSLAGTEARPTRRRTPGEPA
jgi:DNA-3-methyladenine glycosylase